VQIVEDDALIRAVASDVLEDAGFAAFEAENAIEAISVLDEHAEDIAVLLTDVRMPGTIDGITLAKIAEKSWPWICAVITSGSPVHAHKPLHSSHDAAFASGELARLCPSPQQRDPAEIQALAIKNSGQSVILPPADVYFGRAQTILLERERIKRDTIRNRRLQHQRTAA
jgi:CheY-like chemotaxis protein